MPSKALVVDDEAANRDLVVNLLHDLGFTAQGVSSAESAIHALRSSSVDIVLADTRMPGMGGVRLTRKLLETNPDLPVVLLAGRQETSVARAAIHCGAADVVIKPIDPAALRLTVECSLERKAKMAKRTMEEDIQARFQVVRALAAAIDARQSYTAEHSRRVAEVSTRIGARLGLGIEDLYVLDMAAQVHDLGKIGVPDTVLEKPAELSRAEWRRIHQHPGQGAAIVGTVSELAAVANVVRHHHERFDGNGYPDQQAGDNIPLMSRIICVADALDAMTSDRPYRARVSLDDSLQRLDDASGSQFDPDVVRTCSEVIADPAFTFPPP